MKEQTGARSKKLTGATEVGQQFPEWRALQDEHLQVKKELKASEERYKSILENIEEAYLELDLKGNITFYNQAAAKMLAYSPQELMGMNYRQYVSPQDAKRIFKIFNAIYRTGQPAEVFDYQIINKDGSRMFREMTASLIRDSEGNPIGFRCLARDVTKRKLAEEELRKKDRELEIKSGYLAESNAALKVLLKQREEDKIELERNILANIGEIIMPYIEELKKTRLTPAQMICVNTIESNLKNISSPFLRNLTLNCFNLTPKEFQVANLVKEGRTTKEIADFLNVSTGAIDFHRNRIRKKLGLNCKKINLRSFLMTLS